MSRFRPLIQWMKDWKNVTIALLALLVFILGGALTAEHAQTLIPWGKDQPQGELVSVLDVVLDREQLRSLDIIFDRPLGEERLGEILTQDPVVIEPPLGGVWRWRGTNVLRFEPTGRFAIGHGEKGKRLQLPAP